MSFTRPITQCMGCNARSFFHQFRAVLGVMVSQCGTMLRRRDLRRSVAPHDSTSLRFPNIDKFEEIEPQYKCRPDFPRIPLLRRGVGCVLPISIQMLPTDCKGPREKRWGNPGTRALERNSGDILLIIDVIG